MLVAVIIPFRGDPATLQWTLEGFAQQLLPVGTTLDVRLCGDGVAVPPTPPPGSSIRFTTLKSPRVGISQAKNLLLQHGPADIVIFANGDTRPIPTFVQAHVARLQSLPANCMVLGSSPYETAAAPTVFDVLKEEAPMIFFYNQLQPLHTYDFRHAWNLNVSVRYADLQRIHFFNPLFRPYGFEDLDLAFRLMGPESKSVYYDPAAQVLHRHPMTFDDYLDREELLGIMTPVLAAANPALFQHLHNTSDVAALAGQFETWLGLDRPSHAWTYQRLQEWLPLPASTLGEGQSRSRVLRTLYQLHIPLKRLAFRLGYLRGVALAPDAHWQTRAPRSLWRQFTASAP